MGWFVENFPHFLLQSRFIGGYSWLELGLFVGTVSVHVFLDDVNAHLIKSKLVQELFRRHVLGFEKFSSALVEEKYAVEGLSVSVEVKLVFLRVKVVFALFKVTQQSVRISPKTILRYEVRIPVPAKFFNPNKIDYLPDICITGFKYLTTNVDTDSL